VFGDCPDISLSPPPHTPQDDKLTSWLRLLNCDTETIGRFADEEYTKSDVLQFVSRDDLWDEGMVGEQGAVWWDNGTSQFWGHSIA